jgi:hypothetical protein
MRRVACAAPFMDSANVEDRLTSIRGPNLTKGQCLPSYLSTQGIERSMSETSLPPPKLIFSKGMAYIIRLTSS